MWLIRWSSSNSICHLPHSSSNPTVWVSMTFRSGKLFIWSGEAFVWSDAKTELCVLIRRNGAIHVFWKFDPDENLMIRTENDPIRRKIWVFPDDWGRTSWRKWIVLFFTSFIIHESRDCVTSFSLKPWMTKFFFTSLFLFWKDHECYFSSAYPLFSFSFF